MEKEREDGVSALLKKCIENRVVVVVYDVLSERSRQKQGPCCVVADCLSCVGVRVVGTDGVLLLSESRTERRYFRVVSGKDRCRREGTSLIENKTTG